MKNKFALSLVAALAMNTIGSLALAGVPTLPPVAVAEEFSVMTLDNKLIAAVMGDTCNSMSAQLVIPSACQAGQTPQSAAQSCNVELFIMQTVMGCSDNKSIVRVLTVDLAEAGLSPQAKFLNVKYGDTVVRVKRKQ